MINCFEASPLVVRLGRRAESGLVAELRPESKCRLRVAVREATAVIVHFGPPLDQPCRTLLGEDLSGESNCDIRCLDSFVVSRIYVDKRAHISRLDMRTRERTVTSQSLHHATPVVLKDVGQSLVTEVEGVPVLKWLESSPED